jgi:hypothetical protein
MRLHRVGGRVLKVMAKIPVVFRKFADPVDLQWHW